MKKKSVLEEEDWPLGSDAQAESEGDENERAGQGATLAMPVIALRGLTVFPSMVIHFDIGREKSIQALEKAMLHNQTVFLVAQKNDVEIPHLEDLYTMGTVVKIKQMLRISGDNIRVLVDGDCRGRLCSLVLEDPYLLAVVEKIEEPYTEARRPAQRAKNRAAIRLFTEYLDKHPQYSAENAAGLEAVEDTGRLADIIASNTDLKNEDSQKVLEELDPEKRLDLVMRLLSEEIKILGIESQINNKVRSSLEKNQREYYLREQMKVIQEELDGGGVESEAEGWRRKAAELNLPAPVAEKLEKEIDRFSKMGAFSADAAVSRTYIEWILDLPWNKYSEEDPDLIKAKAVLDREHYGLDKVKDRIIEYLAVQQLAGSDKGSILCLVGPPGVGKTSIAKSVANALGRAFVHMSLGGVRDEAEIRGHRRTYVGAIPGRIMSAIRECGSSNPVFLLDEVDKIGADFRGDPASALLEVLDPEQNKEFTDHYLEIPYDLSKVMFITTANTDETIPPALLDRMEVLTLTGYTREEKLNIAKTYLVPKQIKAHGLTRKQISITKPALCELIDHYTRESGVRALEKEIAALCRKTARRIVEGETEKVSIGAKQVQELLGKRRYHYDRQLGKSEVGVATGLAWTVVGGTTLFIETAVLPGTGRLQLTGQLGDVMQESARTAISYIRSQASRLGIKNDFYKTKDIHIHIPEGATPKDGPSAGVTMCISAISALTGRRVRKDVAMTGEISLRGKILPVGGIKEKMLAAHRMGIHKVLLPEDNRADMDELPQTVLDDMEFVLIGKVDDALQEALL